jgi:hypothetical protein
MKHIKLFESYFDEGNGDDFTSNDRYEEAKMFAEEYNDEYKYVVFQDGKPVHGWEYLEDSVIDGVLESSFGYSQSEIDDEAETLLDEVLEYTDGDFEDFDGNLWDEFSEKLSNFVNAMNNIADEGYTHEIEIVKVN